MRRRRVEIEVVFLDVLAVVPLAVGETERTLLEDGIPLVPECQGEAQPLLVVGETAEAVFAPPIGPRAQLVVREVVPGVAVRAVVFADRPPLPRSGTAPLLPGNPRLAGLVQPLLLGAVDDAGLDRLLPCPWRSPLYVAERWSALRDLVQDLERRRATPSGYTGRIRAGQAGFA